YRVFDTQQGQPMAVETVREAYATNLTALHVVEKRLERQVEAGLRIGSHPHIVQTHDLLRDDRNVPFLVLEFMPGGPLVDHMRRGPSSLSDALRIATDAARGLAAAHQVGLVHRDITPAHIFVTAEGRAKVGRF